jgi:hypothetical protein
LRLYYSQHRTAEDGASVTQPDVPPAKQRSAGVLLRRSTVSLFLEAFTRTKNRESIALRRFSISSDRHETELKDAGDAWLAFFAISVLATVILTAVLWQHVSFYWSLVGAVPLAMIVGWTISLIRPVRKIVSGIVQWLFDCITIFS